MLKGTGVQATYEELLRLAYEFGDVQGQQAAAHDEERQTPMVSAQERQDQTVDQALAAYRGYQQEHNAYWQIPDRSAHLWLMTYALAYFAGYQGYRDRLARYRAGQSQRVASEVVNYLVRLTERRVAEKNWGKWQRRNLETSLLAEGVKYETFRTLPKRQLVLLLVNRFFPLQPSQLALEDLGINLALLCPRDDLPSATRHSIGENKDGN